MYPGPVVYDLDVLEQIQRRLAARGIDPYVHALRLDQAHERLHGGVVPRRGYRAHRGADAVLAHGLGKRQRHVLRAVVTAVYASPGVVSPGQGHLQRLVGQLGRDVGPHGPARDPPQSYVHHERRVQPALPGLHIGDVGDGLAALSWAE